MLLFEMLESFKVFGAAAFATAPIGQFAELYGEAMAIAASAVFVFYDLSGYRIDYFHLNPSL